MKHLAEAIDATEDHVRDCIDFARSLRPEEMGRRFVRDPAAAMDERMAVLLMDVDEVGAGSERGRFAVAARDFFADAALSRYRYDVEVRCDGEHRLTCGNEAARELSALCMTASRLVKACVTRGRDFEEWLREAGVRKGREHGRGR
jgi:hypothetical protein